MNRLTEKHKLRHVCSFEGEALDWYQWEEEWELIASWKKFRELFLDRFQSAEEADRYSHLMKLHKCGR